MSENARWQWKQMPGNYHASYYNEKDYSEGRTFVIVDTVTQQEYIYPKTETRKDENGRPYTQRIIDGSLWRKEFMYWACSTSPDFGLYLGEDWLDDKMLEILVSTPQNPRVIYKIKHKLNQELCEKAFATNPDVYTELPQQYLTPEMTEKYVSLPDASWYYIPTAMRNKEIFIKLYSNLSSENKIKLLKGNGYRIDYDPSYITKEMAEEVLGLDITVIERIPNDFITEDHSKKAIEVDGSYLRFVPMKYRTKKLCEKAFNNNPAETIEHIPVQFHTLEMHKKVIDIRAVYISRIPEEVLSDEIIRYALSKSAASLGGIPEERRTEEICNYASSVSATAFSHIPNKYKTYDICLRAVMANPKLIKKVPVEVLNQQFVDALKLASVIIPSSAVGYIKECLLVHERLQQEDLSIKANEGKTGEEMLGEVKGYEGEFTKIPLETVPGLLTQSTLNYLQSNEITTIGDLLTKATAPDFIISLGKRNIVNEILGAAKLMKCKYLDEDPLISEDEEMDMDTLSEKMGFSVRTMNCLRRAGYTPSSFFELMRKPGIREIELLRIRNMGDNGVTEIVNKTQIVFDYHERHKKKESESSEKTSSDVSQSNTNPDAGESLESLNEELLKLREEMRNLTARTDAVLAKIQQKMMEQTKGGVLK